jgi:hypothetical protein
VTAGPVLFCERLLVALFIHVFVAGNPHIVAVESHPKVPTPAMLYFQNMEYRHFLTNVFCCDIGKMQLSWDGKTLLRANNLLRTL